MSLAADREDQEEGLIVLRSVERPEVDIVFIHGLGGHPYTTWACPRRKQIPANVQCNPIASKKPSYNRQLLRNRGSFRRSICSVLGCGRRAAETEDPLPTHVKTEDLSPQSPEALEDPSPDIYWPRDLLALESHCRTARILAYGYDSKVTRGFSTANQNNLFAHARDLLYALQREKPARRPLIFVAHSLGGLLIKEVLRRSEASEEAEFKDIVQSAKGIIFLGTPHRGSPGMADLGETVRSIASTILRVDSNAALLRALGTDSPELELGRESFTVLWRKHGFRVKTFQEARGISGANVGPLNSKVVPDTSSTLDDPKEHAETISANHMNMCRFDSEHDAGYRKISHEIRTMILLAKAVPNIDTDGKAFLRSLAFSEMDNRRGNIQRALDDTCSWLYMTPQYRDWIDKIDVAENHGLLWVKGKPGSGKSTLMKDALRRAEMRYEGTQTTTAAFFFNARGTETLEKTPLGLYRSLLHQVLHQDALALAHLTPIFKQKAMFGPAVTWHQEELQDLLSHVFATCESRPAVLFIDAMDECKDDEVRDLVRFFKVLSKKAYEVGADLKICLSSRHYPHISIDGCLEVVVEDHNRPDILLFIVEEAEDNRPIADLKNEIFERSSGVFLWVVLAIAMLRKCGRGKSLKWLQQKLGEIPAELDTLFRALFSQQDRGEASRVVLLMQIMLFRVEPLTRSQIHLALAFGETPYESLGAWEDSVEYLETPDKIHEMIIDLSKGLLEQAPSSVVKDKEDGANSVPQQPTYQFIHETVREFFLSGDGFKLLRYNPPSLVGSGNAAMVNCFVNYLGAEEFSSDLPNPKDHLELLDVFRPDSKYGYLAAGPAKIFAAKNPNLSLMSYVCVHLFAHLEAAERNGEHQDLILRRLADDSCELLLRLEHSPFATRYVAKSSLLMASIDFGAFETTRRILNLGYPVNQPAGAPQKYAIHAAASIKFKNSLDARLIDLLLAYGADVSLRNWYGQTPLHIAATKGPELLQVILGRKPNVNAQDNDGETALHRAIHSSAHYPEQVRLLVAHGARVDIADSRGRTPLDIARKGPLAPSLTMEADRETIIKLLIEAQEKRSTSCQAWKNGFSDFK